jgi:hypothetical protein
MEQKEDREEILRLLAKAYVLEVCLSQMEESTTKRFNDAANIVEQHSCNKKLKDIANSNAEKILSNYEESILSIKIRDIVVKDCRKILTQLSNRDKLLESLSIISTIIIGILAAIIPNLHITDSISVVSIQVVNILKLLDKKSICSYRHPPRYKNTRYPMFKAAPSFFAISLPMERLAFSISEMWRWGIPIMAASSAWVTPSLERAPLRTTPGNCSSVMSGNAWRQGMESRVTVKPRVVSARTASS